MRTFYEKKSMGNIHSSFIHIETLLDRQIFTVNSIIREKKQNIDNIFSFIIKSTPLKHLIGIVLYKSN